MLFVFFPELWAKLHATAGFLYRAGAETNPNFRDDCRVSLRTIHRIPQPLVFLGFSGCTLLVFVLLSRANFPRRLSLTLGSQEQLCIKPPWSSCQWVSFCLPLPLASRQFQKDNLLMGRDCGGGESLTRGHSLHFS